MKRLYSILLLILAVTFTSCFSDEGNYDYKDIQKLTIKFEQDVINTSIDETVEIDPILNVNIDETSSNHTFTWTLDGRTRPEWNQKKFIWKVDELIPNGKLILTIKDKRYDIIYSNSISFNVIALYNNDDSWMILSDKDGESILSFLAVTEVEKKEGSEQYFITKSQFIPDAYSIANEGKSLGKGPIAIQERFRESVDVQTDEVVGNVCIFQESGGVELNGTDFSKEMDIVQSFYGGQYPNGVSVIKPGSYMHLIDILSDQEGRLYSRIKKVPTVFHSEYFLHTPLTVNGESEVLTQCTVSRGYYRYNRYGYAVLYDGKNKRLLAAVDGNEYTSLSKIEGMPEYADDIDVSKIIPLDNFSGYEMLYIKQCAIRSNNSMDYAYHMILKNESGELFDQYFVSGKKTYATPRQIIKASLKKITGLPSTPECIAYPIYDPQQYAFFSVGSTLYMLDLLNMSSVDVYYKFDSKITSLNADSKSNVHLAVGLEDGTFYVLGILGAKNIKEEDKILYKSTEKVGKIVDIQFKCNNVWNY